MLQKVTGFQGYFGYLKFQGWISTIRRLLSLKFLKINPYVKGPQPERYYIRFFGDFCGCFMCFVQGFWCQVFRWHLGAYPPKNYCNTSHLGKRKINLQSALGKGYASSLEGKWVLLFLFWWLLYPLTLTRLKEKVPFNTPSFTFPINHARKASRKRLLQGPTINRAKWTGILSSVYHCWWLVVSSPNWFLLWLCIPTDP